MSSGLALSLNLSINPSFAGVSAKRIPPKGASKETLAGRRLRKRLRERLRERFKERLRERFRGIALLFPGSAFFALIPNFKPSFHPGFHPYPGKAGVGVTRKPSSIGSAFSWHLS